MNNSALKPLPKAVSVKVRVDGTAVAIVKTHKIGFKQAQLPIDDLPLTENSYIELEFFDGADRLILPAWVSHVGDTELTADYEQTGETFDHWLNLQLSRQ